MEDETLKQILKLLKNHAQKSDKLVACIRPSWTRVGQGFDINGYTIEYKDKQKTI